jgi:hypothetical protein
MSGNLPEKRGVMKANAYIFTWMMCIVLLIFPAGLAFAETLFYAVKDEETVSSLEIKIRKDDDGGHVYLSKLGSVQQYYRYDENNTLTEWRFSDKEDETEFTALSRGGEIAVTGFRRGEPFSQTLSVGEQAWLQNSEFGLLEFIRSAKNQMDFVVIKPDDLSVNRLKVRKGAREKINYRGERVSALRLKATPPGLLSVLWQAEYWYRVPDYLFIRYETKGAPGLPHTIIELDRRER